MFIFTVHEPDYSIDRAECHMPDSRDFADVPTAYIIEKGCIVRRFKKQSNVRYKNFHKIAL